MTATLTDRFPQVPADRLLAAFVPPRHFAEARFDGYVPDAEHPSQAEARDRMAALAAGLAAPRRRPRLRRPAPPPALYLDGGFGVGKTHLLAALAREVGPGVAAYGTFVEYTHLVGALGFGAAVRALGQRRVICIDEFELDDPGDTVLMSRLLRELSDAGVTIVATSNTLPESLGEGRFAAEDFLREIQALAARFDVLRIDGPDYRHRSAPGVAPGLSDDDVRAATAAVPGAACDDLGALIAHLRRVHPVRFGALLEDVAMLGLTGVGPVGDQADALRLVVLVDRLYDRDVPVLLGGRGTEELFTDAMLRGGYRKKYLRALSRLAELAARGRAQSAAAPPG
ncbi:cell division protein ZapE [Actinotalea fermentans]|uniref:Cell division protein ZapE n=1 Tax=Actinotalea fermentans TaxID=43671 RepID=A0A511YU93_9CELL|nr:cell division protein ZapE [Actinotalea fermentans]KGM17151.1 ATPase [Actinotalea fermentans ATCC 43279 = JCM 9966 = DSM 3133]GEN78764.1 cell division protein ZapE [Actinotalea fermentans]